MQRAEYMSSNIMIAAWMSAKKKVVKIISLFEFVEFHRNRKQKIFLNVLCKRSECFPYSRNALIYEG